MRSKGILEGVDFGRDVPTSPEVSQFLWRIRAANRMTPEEYLRFLQQFRDSQPSERRLNTETDEPFEL